MFQCRYYLLEEELLFLRPRLPLLEEPLRLLDDEVLLRPFEELLRPYEEPLRPLPELREDDLLLELFLVCPFDELPPRPELLRLEPPRWLLRPKRLSDLPLDPLRSSLSLLLRPDA